MYQYQVQMQYIPGNDQICVARLNPEDPIYEYVHEGEAVAKAAELQATDDTGRQYRVVNLFISQEETPTL